MTSATARIAAEGFRPWAAAIFAVAMLSAFAIAGPTRPLGWAAIGASLLALAIFLPPRGRVLLVSISALAVLAAQSERGLNYFDPVVVVLAFLALAWTLAHGSRAVWDVRSPGWLSLVWLVTPLFAVPSAIISLTSFLGVYKLHVLHVALFHALRRLVPWRHSNMLLWAFPIIGVVGTIQLLLKTQGLGALLFARMSFRNFYTRLPWGQSDFISAFLEACICVSIVLLFLERKTILRIMLLGAIVLMFQAVLILFSRAGVIGFGLFALTLALGLGGRRGWMILFITVVVAAVAAMTPGGQTTMARFTDPHEFGSVEYRVLIWVAAVGRIIAHPWTGMGLNQGRYQHDVIGEESTNNFLMDVLTEQGVFGLLGFLAILVGMFRLCLRAEPAGVTGSFRPVRVALIATLVQILAHASVEPTLFGYPLAMLFIYLLAWLALQDPAGREVAAS